MIVGERLGELDGAWWGQHSRDLEELRERPLHRVNAARHVARRIGGAAERGEVERHVGAAHDNGT